MSEPLFLYTATEAEHRRAKAEGNAFVRDETGVFEWPFCTINGCFARVSYGSRRFVGSKLYCWPHTPSSKSFDELIGEVSNGTAISAHNSP